MESNVSRMFSFLPYKILKASRVCKSRLLAIPWFCLRSSVTHGRDQQQRFQNARFFYKQKCLLSTYNKPFLGHYVFGFASHKTETNFSQHSANYKALQTQPKLVQAKLPVAFSTSETLSMEIVRENLLIIHTSNKKWVSYQGKIAIFRRLRFVMLGSFWP